LNNPTSVIVDDFGGLYVTDSSNHRILYFPKDSIIATSVIGQINFSSNLANLGGTTSANSLNTPRQLRVDTDGGIYIADINNHRVLYY
jgi:hypothetical protein